MLMSVRVLFVETLRSCPQWSSYEQGSSPSVTLKARSHGGRQHDVWMLSLISIGGQSASKCRKKRSLWRYHKSALILLHNSAVLTNVDVNVELSAMYENGLTDARQCTLTNVDARPLSTLRLRPGGDIRYVNAPLASADARNIVQSHPMHFSSMMGHQRA